MRELALRVLAATKGAAQTSVHTINLLEPAGVEGLRSRNESRLLLRVRTGGCGVFRSIAGLAAALGSRSRRWVTSGTVTRGCWNARVLPAIRHLVHTVGDGPAVIAREGVNGLPNRPVSGQNLLQGWPTECGVRRDGKRVLREAFVKALPGQRMHNLKKPQSSCKHLKGLADSWLGRARHGHDGCGPGQIFLRCQKLPKERAVIPQTAGVVPGEDIRFRRTEKAGIQTGWPAVSTR